MSARARTQPTSGDARQAGVGSLRELAAGFNQHRSHHDHLGAVEVRRFTLAQANDKRSAHFNSVQPGLFA